MEILWIIYVFSDYWRKDQEVLNYLKLDWLAG
jgi:hypothetical protein